jgi:exodeoxyribonuclease VII small subunit
LADNPRSPPVGRPAAEAAQGREPSFEQSLAELEQIVRQLEEGQLGLSDSLARYELGVKRLKECYQLLQRAEQRIEVLERVDADGEPVARPFDAEATIDRHVLAQRDVPPRDLPQRDGKPPKPEPRRTKQPPQPSDDGTGPRDLFQP